MVKVEVDSSASLSSLFKGPAGAATLAGVLEIAVFHPADTCAKRLMSHEAKIVGANIGETRNNLNQIIFKKHATSGIVQKIKYLYPGSLFAIYYKVLQRVLKFAGQPIVRDFFNKNYGDSFKRVFGKKGKLWTEACAGSVVGVSEIVLLPLDRLKILSQTNQAALEGRSIFKIIAQEGRGLYAGTGATIARNAPGSFFLFGGTAITKDFIFGLEDYSKATFAQNFVASGVGSCCSIIFTNPMDVVKTRIQNKAFGENVSGLRILGNVLKHEGITAFTKGLTPKVISSAPKLVFAYTMTEYFTKVLKALQ